MRPPARNLEKGCTSRIRLEESNVIAREVPVTAAELSAGTLAVADTDDGNALLVVVAFVGLAGAAEEAALTPVADSTSAPAGTDEFVAAAGVEDV
jgi:hypothetical protein